MASINWHSQKEGVLISYCHYNKPKWLNTTQIYLPVLYVRSLTRVLLSKIKVLTGLCAEPSAGSREHLWLAFSISTGFPHSLAHCPLPPSSKPATLHLSDHSSVVISPSDHSQGKSSAFKSSF